MMSVMINGQSHLQISIESFLLRSLGVIRRRHMPYPPRKTSIIEQMRLKYRHVVGHYNVWDPKTRKILFNEAQNHGLRSYFPHRIHHHELGKIVKKNQHSQVAPATSHDRPHKINENLLHRLRYNLTIMETDSSILGWLRPLTLWTLLNILKHIRPDPRPIKNLRYAATGLHPSQVRTQGRIMKILEYHGSQILGDQIPFCLHPRGRINNHTIQQFEVTNSRIGLSHTPFYNGHL
jgi:hypothetical protein